MALARTAEWHVLIDSMPPELSAFKEAFKMTSTYSIRCAVSMRYSRRFLDEVEDEMPELAIVNVPPLTERETEKYIHLKAPKFRATAAGLDYIYRLTDGIPLFIDSFLNVLSDGIIYGPALLEKNLNAKFQQIAFPWIAELAHLSPGERKILGDLSESPIPEGDADDKEIGELELRGFVYLKEGEWRLTSELLGRVLTELRRQLGCI